MDASSRLKHAACLVCRRSKIRCDWQPCDDRCKKCVQLDAECIRPAYQPGRQKGIKNKRSGVDKALHQIRQAVRKAQHGANKTPESEQILAHLQQLLDESGVNSSHSMPVRNSFSGFQDLPAHQGSSDRAYDDELSDGDGESDMGQDTTTPHINPRVEGSMAIDDAENPLQLLARASYIQPSPSSRYGESPQSIPRPTTTSVDESGHDLHEFFSAARIKLDIGEDTDPISLGLVSNEEAEALFSFFHQRLAHTRWGLDPRLYTATFTRSRSSFLFTSVMAASALFMPSCSALSTRLSNHARKLAHHVITCCCKSVEIVLAFLVNIPWMFPGKQSTDDETCTYMSMATTIATDLSLHKSVVSNGTVDSGIGIALARADCLDPRAALAIDGFPDLDPLSSRGQKILRSRERCWIALFVLERGMSLARGRPFSVPITRSLKDCDSWHLSELADSQDGPLVSMAVLRRDLDGLFITVRGLCDSSCTASDGPLVARSIQNSIEQFFERWSATWKSCIGTGPEQRLPPYVEILVTHTRLSIYGGVINHPTAPLEVRRFFHTAGLSSAVNVMRVAIQGESQLQSMPNNTAIMVSFSACFALTLSAYATGDSVLAPSIRTLIEEVATVLIKIGSVTKHRNGLSVLYGKYLKQIVKRAAGAAPPFRHEDATLSTGDQATSSETPMTNNIVVNPQSDGLWPDTFHFSAMSDDQILRILNEPGNDLEPSFGGLSWEDMNNFDWIYWPEIGL